MKISLSIQLSDPSEYEGGDLEFTWGRSSKFAPKEKGAMVLFPSYSLHKVHPVTKGKRRALVLWAHGPAFR
jgi:PKHD-type hydroxylase